MTNYLIDILMSVYNGEAYLQEQLDSILSQTFSDFRILIRDDGSSDNTGDIIEAYISKYPDKILKINSIPIHLGPVKSYSQLIESSNAGYIMLADQDDIWLSDKIAVTIERMVELDTEFNESVPLLVHTDLSIVDEKLRLIDRSSMSYQGLNPHIKDLSRMFMQNTVSSSTIMINSALKSRILPIPREARMHDWWIALVAGAFGIVDFVNQPTVLYRQHNNNAVGAKKYGFPEIPKKLLEFNEMRQALMQNVDQASAFYHQYEDDVDIKTKKQIGKLKEISEFNFLQQRHIIFKHKFFKHGLLRNLVLLLLMKL